MCGLRGLVSKPESPIINYIKEQNRSTSPLVAFNQEWVQIWILFFILSLSSVICCMSFNLCCLMLSCESIHVSISVCCICPSQTALVPRFLAAQKISGGKELGIFTEIFDRVLEGINSQTPTYYSWHRYQVI